MSGTVILEDLDSAGICKMNASIIPPSSLCRSVPVLYRCSSTVLHIYSPSGAEPEGRACFSARIVVSSRLVVMTLRLKACKLKKTRRESEQTIQRLMRAESSEAEANPANPNQINGHYQSAPSQTYNTKYSYPKYEIPIRQK